MTGEKQQQVTQLVNKEVLANQTMLICDLLDKTTIPMDTIENITHFVCPECNGEMTDITIDYDIAFKCKDCDHSQEEDPDVESHEVYEWWLVSEWLIDRLREKGEVILSYEGSEWWGRKTTGQAIMMDSVMEEIYDDLNSPESLAKKLDYYTSMNQDIDN